MFVSRLIKEYSKLRPQPRSIRANWQLRLKLPVQRATSLTFLFDRCSIQSTYRVLRYAFLHLYTV